MPEDLVDALSALRPLLLDPDRLVRAVAAGRRRGAAPPYRRVEVRPIDLKSGRSLQVVTYDDRQATTRNMAYGTPAGVEVDDLLGQPFGNWHVETTGETVQLRVTKKGQAQVHRRLAAVAVAQRTGHDRAPRHLIDPGDPLFTVLGASAGKRRQVDAFLRVLASAVDEAELPVDRTRPLRVVDLGCGNAYLSFAAYRFLAESFDAVELVGIDLRPQMRERNTALAAELGWSDRVRFVAGTIGDTVIEPGSGSGSAPHAAPVVDVALALHACDTATDDALAQALRWQAPVILAAPCCHHDLQAQLKSAAPPEPYGLLTRHPILRERLGDVLTDAFRAALLRREGYRVEVMAFVSAEYTPRNTMVRAVRPGDRGPMAPDPALAGDYDELVKSWGVTPYLQALLERADG